MASQSSNDAPLVIAWPRELKVGEVFPAPGEQNANDACGVPAPAQRFKVIREVTEAEWEESVRAYGGFPTTWLVSIIPHHFYEVLTD